MPKIAFLGAGNMASAMVHGAIAANSFSASDFTCYTSSGKTALVLATSAKIRNSDSLGDLLREADALVVAFKPQHLATTDPSLASLTEGKLIISVLAGKRLSRLKSTFPKARNIVRAMPNTPGQIGAGITGYCALHPLSSDERALVEKLLGALGQFLEIDEEQMDSLTAVSGSGPAYVFQFAAHLRDAGITAGLAPEIAKKLAIETLLGAARLLARSGAEPEKLRDQVTSPNGTTMAALKRGIDLGWGKIVEEMVLAAKTRSIELSQES